MVTLRRNLGVLRYDSIYFPSEGAAQKIVAGLAFNQLARLFFTRAQLNNASGVLTKAVASTVINDLSEPEGDLWKRCLPYTRTEIRHAEKLADKISIGTNTPAVRRDFLALYNDFARQKTGVWSLSSRQAERFRANGDFRVLYFDGEAAVVNMLLRDEEAGRVRGMLSASRRLAAIDKKQARLFGNLNRLLHWNNMLRYKALGFTAYDWGGISNDPNDGITKFKLSFGGRVVAEQIYFCAGSPRVGRAALALFENLSPRGRRLRRTPAGSAVE